MKNLFRKVDVWFQYVIMALRKIRNPKLGDLVTYNGVECSLIQGVAKPYWDLLPMTKENLSKNKRDILRSVHENDFELKPLKKRFKFSFLSTYKFLMTNWYSIDIRQKGRISYTW